MPMKKTTRMHMMDRIASVLFLCSVATLLFGYGLAVGKYHIFPYQWLTSAVKSASLMVVHDPHHLFPAWHEYSGARTYYADSMAPGTTLLTGYWRTLNWKPRGQ